MNYKPQAPRPNQVVVSVSGWGGRVEVFHLSHFNATLVATHLRAIGTPLGFIHVVNKPSLGTRSEAFLGTRTELGHRLIVVLEMSWVR